MKHEAVKRLSQSHPDHPRAIQALCLLQTRLWQLNTCLDLGIRFDVGLTTAKKRPAPCFHPLPWRVRGAVRPQLKRSKQAVCPPPSLQRLMISTPTQPPLSTPSTAGKGAEITTENSHAVHPAKGEKGRRREAFLRKENEAAHRAPRRVRHSDRMAGDKEERGCSPV